MFLRAQRTGPVFAGLWVLFLALFILSAHWPLDGLMAKSGYYPVTKVKKDLRSHHSGGPDFPLHTVPVGWSPPLDASFLKVDRAQNLRLWPVVASQLIRSPPAIHFL